MTWMTRPQTSPPPAPPQNPAVHHLPLHLRFLVPLPHAIRRLLKLINPLLDASARHSVFQSHVLRIRAQERLSFLAGNSRKLPKRLTMRNGRRMAPGGLTCAGFASSRSSLHASSKSSPRICTHIFTPLHLEHWSYPRSDTQHIIICIPSYHSPIHEYVYDSPGDLVRCYFHVSAPCTSTWRLHRSSDSICTTVF